MYSIVEKFLYACEIHAKQTAIIEGDSCLTYRDMGDIVLKLASALKSYGVGKGSKVALMMFNEKYYFPSLLAILAVEAIPVPINLMYSSDELIHVILSAGVSMVIANKEIVEKYSGLLTSSPLPLDVIISSDEDYRDIQCITHHIRYAVPYIYTRTVDLTKDPAILMYTSGTTAKPKGVMLSNHNLTSNITSLSNLLKFTPEETILLALPKFHTFGQIVGLLALFNGGKIVLIPKFTPHNILSSLEKDQVTILPLVPTMFSLILEYQKGHGFNLSSLKYCISGGAALPVKLLQDIESVLAVPVVEGYGLTETSPVVAINSKNRIPGSIGKPIDHVRVKIINDEGEEVVCGEIGELVVKGPNVMLGYYNNPTETAQCFTHDRWFKTGDMASMDLEGNLYISSERKKDLIICAGENISPRSIEEVIYHYENILECAVVGVQNKRRGEEIITFIVSNTPVNHALLRKHCIEHLPPYKVPKHFFQIDTLPKNAAGKVLKRVLREQAAHKIETLV